MKILGILGGIGPESTVDYYRQVIALYRKERRDGSYPAIVINSIDMAKMLGLMQSGDLASLTSYLECEIARLANAEASLGLIASNTPHIVFDELRRRSPIPLISIVEAACQETRRRQIKRIGLFGTKFTMAGGFYQNAFRAEGIEIETPAEEDQVYIHDKYMNELAHGVFRDETKAGFVRVANRMKKERGIEALLLGGTELPLLLRDAGEVGVPMLDASRIHIEKAVSELLA